MLHVKHNLSYAHEYQSTAHAAMPQRWNGPVLPGPLWAMTPQKSLDGVVYSTRAGPGSFFGFESQSYKWPSEKTGNSKTLPALAAASQDRPRGMFWEL